MGNAAASVFVCLVRCGALPAREICRGKKRHLAFKKQISLGSCMADVVLPPAARSKSLYVRLTPHQALQHRKMFRRRQANDGALLPGSCWGVRLKTSAL